MELVTKKKTTSPVWTYFNLEKDEEGRIKTEDIAVCQKCYGCVHAKGGNTSNLISYLKTHHLTLHGFVCSNSILRVLMNNSTRPSQAL